LSPLRTGSTGPVTAIALVLCGFVSTTDGYLVVATSEQQIRRACASVAKNREPQLRRTTVLQHMHMVLPANTVANHVATGIGKASVVCEAYTHTAKLLAEPV